MGFGISEVETVGTACPLHVLLKAVRKEEFVILGECGPTRRVWS